jgi:transcriptional regulator with XRE-family HTH domain
MVNTEAFVGRLEEILGFYGLTASSFADRIGVQRSSISHLLSGRNKPSLEFVMKVVKTFPEVNLYWLLNGKGSFPHKTEQKKAAAPTPLSTVTTSIESSTGIEKIIVCYSDGTFRTYFPQK